MKEDGPSETKGLVKADCAYQEREGLCESDRIDGDAKSHCDGNGEE